MHNEKLMKLKTELTNEVAREVGYDPTEIRRANIESLVLSRLVMEMMEKLDEQTELLKKIAVAEVKEEIKPKATATTKPSAK